jgi:hypothetical protein
MIMPKFGYRVREEQIRLSKAMYKAFVDKKYIGWGFEKIYNDCKDSYNDTQENKSGQQSEPAQQKADADYIKGWNQAIEDYKNGKLKL